MPSKILISALLSFIFLFSCGVGVANADQPASSAVTADLTPIISAVPSIAGTGGPAVVLQSGLGDGKAAWGILFKMLAERGTVVAFDRPGYGVTPARQGVRDPCTIAAEQRQLLAASGAKPPYVLVGHSLGGLYQYVYAKLYPSDVAGVVLIDPTHPQHWEQVQLSSPVMARVISSMRDRFDQTVRQEFDEHTSCLDRIDLKTPLASPTKLLVRSTFKFVEWGPFEDMTHRLEDDWQRLTGAPAVERIDRAGHYVHRDRPDAVLEAITAMTVKK